MEFLEVLSSVIGHVLDMAVPLDECGIYAGHYQYNLPCYFYGNITM